MGLEQREVKRADSVVSGGAFARRGHNPSASIFGRTSARLTSA